MSWPTTAVPVLPVADLTRALAWYQRLGFELVAEHPGYGILELDGAEVHLNEVDGLAGPHETWSGAYLHVADAEALFERWTAMGAPVLSPPEPKPWGLREFATEDLDGNLWRVGSPLDLPVDGVPDPAEHPTLAAPAPTPAAEPLDELRAMRAAPEPPTEPDGVPPAGEAPTDGSSGTGLDAWFALVAEGRTCAGCGLDVAALPARALGAQVRDETHALGRLLLGADDDLVRVTGPDGSWSALEYGVHVRDLLTVFSERIIRTLAEHDPELGWWDHEEAIADGMANESDVSAVADDLGRNAGKLSESLRMVTDDDWERSATRRDGERFTIELMARFALHEVVHHTADARRALERAGG